MRKGLLLILLVFSVTITAQKVHTVKQGETMESIAKQYGTTVSNLKKLNPNVDMLFAGILLNLPTTSQKQDSLTSTVNKLKLVDRIDMKDGSYVLCKIISVKGSTATIEQEEIKGRTTISTKDINLIEYANGKKRKFK